MDVLIVDDSAAVRKIPMRVLKQSDLPFGKFREANHGREALATRNAEKTGLVLSDINMPNLDGIELPGTRKASESPKAVPIVMVAAGYVRKPFTAEQIEEKSLGIV